MKHKHAEIIKAWADGKIIQYYDGLQDDWYNVDNPSWSNSQSFRVRPDLKPIYPATDLFTCRTAEHRDIRHYINYALERFVSSGQLALYVAEFGVDGLKGQS